MAGVPNNPYASMTKPALIQLARERGYVGFSGRNKSELITMLQNDPNEYTRKQTPMIDPEDAEYPIGSILVVIECYYSVKKEFALVLDITATGRYKVQLLNHIITQTTGDPRHSTYVYKKPLINPVTLLDSVKGDVFYITPEAHRGHWCILEKYDPIKDYVDEYIHDN